MKHSHGKKKVSQYFRKKIELIFLLEFVLPGVCYKAYYLANLSPRNPLGIALQSVIYVYWWPCGQEVGSKFTEVIRPSDTSRAAREKHISFLNGVFRSLQLKVCCTFVTIMNLYSFSFFPNSQPQRQRVSAEQRSDEDTSCIPSKLVYAREHGFHKLLEFLAVYRSNYCCKYDLKIRRAVFLISLMPSATRDWTHSLECCHLRACPGRWGEVLELRCLYKQCLCWSIQGYCSRIKASSFDV